MHICMLRGVNVGGQNKIKMDDLKALFVGLGHCDVNTYIQSGNVVFKGPAGDVSDLASAIEKRIARDLDLRVTALVRTTAELSRVIEDNPFIGQGAEPAKLYVTFLAGSPDPAVVRGLDVKNTEPDEFSIVDREIYVHCPNGYARTKLNNTFWERKLRVAATTRNWNTVNRLIELASG